MNVCLPSDQSFIILEKKTGSVCSLATAILGLVSFPVNGLNANISAFVNIVLSEFNTDCCCYKVPNLSAVSPVKSSVFVGIDYVYGFIWGWKETSSISPV